MGRVTKTSFSEGKTYVINTRKYYTPEVNNRYCLYKKEESYFLPTYFITSIYEIIENRIWFEIRIIIKQDPKGPFGILVDCIPISKNHFLSLSDWTKHLQLPRFMFVLFYVPRYQDRITRSRTNLPFSLRGLKVFYPIPFPLKLH